MICHAMDYGIRPVQHVEHHKWTKADQPKKPHKQEAQQLGII